MLQNIILISVTTTTSKFTLTTTKESVLISSPNYPGNYPNNVEMTVNISAPRGTNVELIFLDLELSPSCGYPLIISQGMLYLLF